MDIVLIVVLLYNCCCG